MVRHWAYAVSLTYYRQIGERTLDDETKLTQVAAK